MPQPKEFANNDEAQFALATIEKYISDSATLAFPMIEWDVIVTYDRDDAGNIVAVIQEKSGIFYNVMFAKGDPNPILQRFSEFKSSGTDITPDNYPLLISIVNESEFKSSGTDITPDNYPLLISIVNESYTDELDRISSARENEDGSILVVGVDGGKQIACKISGDRIRIKLLNPDAAEFAAPKKSDGTLKKKTCKTGLSCGGSCISKTKVCARALSLEQQKQYKELKKRLKGGDSEAAKGIDDLKNEQQRSGSQASPKPEAKVETKPTNSETKPMTGPVKKDLQAETIKTWNDQLTRYRKEMADFAPSTGTEGEIEILRQKMILNHLDNIQLTLSQPLSKELIAQRKDSIHEAFPEQADPKQLKKLKELVEKYSKEADLQVQDLESAHKINESYQKAAIEAADKEDELVRGSRTKENYDTNTARIVELDKARRMARVAIDKSFKIAQDKRFDVKKTKEEYSRMLEDLG